jgi:hypothetical protein
MLNLYLNKSIIKLQLFGKNYPIINNFILELKNIKNMSKQLEALHFFIFKHHDQPFGKMSVILPIQITGLPVHIETIKTITLEDIQNCDRKLFALPPHSTLPELQDSFSKSNSTQNIKKAILEKKFDDYYGYKDIDPNTIFTDITQI